MTEIIRKISIHINPILSAEFMHQITPLYVSHYISVVLVVYITIFFFFFFDVLFTKFCAVT